ncbi:hypothetical protein RDI58_029757 [Solanum bulbocastanum]|uniref:Uncharacterized protein n=1 Tax=Solanum bulbocastanum TaxID=147425 RepID=A0AAN8SY70_SOLBU
MDSINSNLRLVKSIVVKRNATYSEGLTSLGELIEHGDKRKATYSEGLASLGELIEHGDSSLGMEDCSVFLIEVVVWDLLSVIYIACNVRIYIVE